MSDWKSLLSERFRNNNGCMEELHILQESTYPGAFYVGPVYSRYRIDGPGMAYTPRFNGTSYYHRTQDEAINALIALVGKRGN